MSADTESKSGDGSTPQTPSPAPRGEEGWVLVPREPFEAWHEAAKAWKVVASYRTDMAVLVSSDRLRAALEKTPPLAAAPTPSVEET